MAASFRSRIVKRSRFIGTSCTSLASPARPPYAPAAFAPGPSLFSHAVQFNHLSVRLPARNRTALFCVRTLFGALGPVMAGGGVALFLRLVESAIPDPSGDIHNFQLRRRLSASVSRTICPFPAACEADPHPGPGVQSRFSGLLQIFRLPCRKPECGGRHRLRTAPCRASPGHLFLHFSENRLSGRFLSGQGEGKELSQLRALCRLLSAADSGPDRSLQRDFSPIQEAGNLPLPMGKLLRRSHTFPAGPC